MSGLAKKAVVRSVLLRTKKMSAPTKDNIKKSLFGMYRLIREANQPIGNAFGHEISTPAERVFVDLPRFSGYHVPPADAMVQDYLLNVLQREAGVLGDLIDEYLLLTPEDINKDDLSTLKTLLRKFNAGNFVDYTSSDSGESV